MLFFHCYFYSLQAAVIHATSKQGHNLDSYVTKVLFGHEEGQENLSNIIEAVRSKSFCTLMLLGFLTDFLCEFTFNIVSNKS